MAEEGRAVKFNNFLLNHIIEHLWFENAPYGLKTAIF